MNSRNVKLFEDNEEKLKQALLLLLQLKDTTKISVMELCQIAKINRSTFYNHYEDIYGLIESIENNMQLKYLDSIIKISKGEDFVSICTGKLLHYVSQNQSFYKSFYMRTAASGMKDCLEFIWKELTFPNESADFNRDDPLQMIKCRFFTGGFNELIKDWLFTDCQTSQNEICNYILSCVSP